MSIYEALGEFTPPEKDTNKSAWVIGFEDVEGATHLLTVPVEALPEPLIAAAQMLWDTLITLEGQPRVTLVHVTPEEGALPDEGHR